MRCPSCGFEITRPQPKPLTPRQRQVYEFVRDYVLARHYAPSFREIAEALKLRSLSSVYDHLRELEVKGWIRRGNNLSRSIEVLAT